MTNDMIFAGFGGQGVLLMGQLVTYAGMYEDKSVAWCPSYGPEMRGGTCNCSVVVDDEMVGSPIVTEADTLIVMNQPSLAKFENNIKPGGKLFINSSLIELKPNRSDIEIFYVPCNEIADGLGNVKCANMVMLGAVIEKTKVVSPGKVIEALKYIMGEKKAHLIPLNEQAIEKGAEAVS